MKRARTFTQWLNEAEQNSPWFIPVSNLISDMLKSTSPYSVSFSEETGEIIIDSDTEIDDLDWPGMGDRFWTSNTLYLTPVFGEVSPELERLYRAQAARDPESFLDELIGFNSSIEKRFWSKDVDIDHPETEDHGRVEFPVDENEDFGVVLIDFIDEYMGSFGFYETELNDILRQSFPWAYEDEDEDEDGDEDGDDDDRLYWP
jgi:hypothetical protein